MIVNNCRKITFIIILINCSFLKLVNAQNCAHKQDTVYIFLLSGTLKNQRPIVSYALYKDLKEVPKLDSNETQDEYMCKFFKNAIAFTEPYLTIEKYKKCYGFSSQKQENKFYHSLFSKLKKLNKRYTSFHAIPFSKGRRILLQCVKVVGEFWVLPNEMQELNNIDHSFTIKEGCYKADYHYDLKNIIRIERLNESEQEILISKSLAQKL